MAAENGEEKLIAVARHIAKTLGHNESMADDILQIFSTFDGRFSREKLSDDPPSLHHPHPHPRHRHHQRHHQLHHHDSRPPPPPFTFEHSLKALDRQISQYVSADQPIWSDSADSAAFLDSVDELISIIRELTPLSDSAPPDKAAGACFSRADDLIQHSMFRLEEEFRLLMERGGESFDLNGSSSRPYESTFDSEEDDDEEEFGDDQVPVAKPLADYDVVIDALPSGTIKDLHEIAKRMVVAGCGEQCSHVYGSCRRDFLEESLYRMGLQKLSTEEVQKMTWQELEDEIEKWIKAANVTLRVLFPSERRLCDRVFFGFSSAADWSFMEVCRVSTVQILNFANALAIGSRSPERLFRVLDLYETMRDLMPEFESNFSDPYCLPLRNEAVAIVKRLGEAVKGIFMELENLIRRDPAKAQVPRGGLHPITRYVMNYLRAACRSRESLEHIFEDNVKDPSASSLSVQMAWIMELLESNLEMKSKIYGDPALCFVFMLNNERYIVQKVKDSELGSLLGDDWIRKHTVKVKHFISSYQRSSWNKVLGVLKVDSNSSAGSNVVGKPISMKEKIKLFNLYFEENYKSQSQWIIFDEQQRNELRMSLKNLLLPAYENFIGRFLNTPEVGKLAANLIKYRPEDIEVNINQFFQGGSGSAGGRK